MLGQTFTAVSLAALGDESATETEWRLRRLVRREILFVQADPRSPERGQYGFVQGLIREVAYGMLSRERRERHLAAARYYEGVGDDELAGVLASHYVAAFGASSLGRRPMPSPPRRGWRCAVPPIGPPPSARTAVRRRTSSKRWT